MAVVSTAGALVNIYKTKNAKMYYQNGFFIAKRKLKQNEKNGMNYLKRDEKKKTVM